MCSVECLSVIFPPVKDVGKVEFKLLLWPYTLLRVNQTGGGFSPPWFQYLNVLCH